MTYTSIKEYINNDLSMVYRVETYGCYLATMSDILYTNCENVYLFHPYLRYGDYDNSCEIERSNVRVFEEHFKGVAGWEKKHFDFKHYAIIISIHSTNQDIIDTLVSLDDYPVLNEMDCQKMKIEMELEAWDAFIKREFLDMLERKFDATCIDPDNDKIYSFYETVKEYSNTDTSIQSGGNVYVDLKKIVSVVNESPSFLEPNE